MESKVDCCLIFSDCDGCTVVICRTNFLPLVTAVAYHPFAVLDLELRSNSESTYLLAVDNDPFAVESPVVAAVCVKLYAYYRSDSIFTLRTLDTLVSLWTFVSLVTLLTVLECVCKTVCESHGEAVAYFCDVLDVEVIFVSGHECLDECNIAVEVLAEFFKVGHPVLKVINSAGQFFYILTCAECQHC